MAPGGNQTTATQPTGAKKKGVKRKAEKNPTAPAPRKEKRSYKRSTLAQKGAVRAIARGLIDRHGLEKCAADNQQHQQPHQPRQRAAPSPKAHFLMRLSSLYTRRI